MQFIVRDNNEIWYKSTLAHALDRRKVALGEPKRDDLPTVINPLQLLQGLVSRHLIPIRIPDTDSPLMRCLPLLQHLVPAGKRLLVVRDLTPVTTDVVLQPQEECVFTAVWNAEDTYTGANA